MASKRGREPAYVQPPHRYVSGGPDANLGMTIREAFAMAALTGIRASGLAPNADQRLIARLAVEDADALLAALAEEKP